MKMNAIEIGECRKDIDALIKTYPSHEIEKIIHATTALKQLCDYAYQCELQAKDLKEKIEFEIETLQDDDSVKGINRSYKGLVNICRSL